MMALPDCEWDLPSGEIVVLEIDGGHHMEVAHWQADMRRERGIVISAANGITCYRP